MDTLEVNFLFTPYYFSNNSYSLPLIISQQMGRSRGFSDDHKSEDSNFHLEEHHLQIRHTKCDHLKQRTIEDSIIVTSLENSTQTSTLKISSHH